MTAPKTFGQIAHENRLQLTLTEPIPWSGLSAWWREDCESMARAVALECSRICIEIARMHMHKAIGGDTSGASDCRQQAAIECSSAILEAISRGAKDTP